MAGALIMMALLAGACAYLVGHAFTVSRDSMLRTAPGGILLAACVIEVLLALSLPDVIWPTASGAWPAGFGPDLYRMLCVALAVAGLLVGMRVWRMRIFSPGAGLFSIDESPVSRAESALPLADSLADALDVLAREKVAQRDVARMAPIIRRVGSRYFHQLPEKHGEVYTLVARQLPPAVAADVTGLLLEGAGRK